MKQGWRISRALSVCILLLVVGLCAGWAGGRIFASPPAIEDASYTLVTVATGSVSGRVAINVRAQWGEVLAARNLVAGTVTQVSPISSEDVEAGTSLYAVDLSPVVVLQGSTPAFRTMQRGDRGADVAQLQEFLTEAGHLTGEADGTLGLRTTTAVRMWQRAAGMPVDGVVDRGEVLFVQQLPGRVVVDSQSISLGAQVTGGEQISILAEAPSFIAPISPTQAAAIPDEARVEVTAPSGEIWSARIAGQVTSEDGEIDLQLTGVGQDSICGDSCVEIPTGPGLLLASRVITVEQVDGLVVPSTAVLTLPDGSTVVIDADGQPHRVTVLAGARGMTAIEGVEAGLRVRAPAESG